MINRNLVLAVNLTLLVITSGFLSPAVWNQRKVRRDERKLNIFTRAKSDAGELEIYFENLYSRSSQIKCPFFKRRAADLIDSMSMLFQFIIYRHKSINAPSFFQPPGCKAVGHHVERDEDGAVLKIRGLAVDEVAKMIEQDWIGGCKNTKGYYITGKLNSRIYRDDCLFDGPDPDMPVRGLRKYLDAASKLFETGKSDAELLDISFNEANRFIDVRWRLSGILMLPWHPSVKPWTGTTRYYLDDDGLICVHREEWDISVFEAFYHVIVGN